MHFAVAVISDGTKTVEELLAPYQENNMGDCPKEYLAFVDETDEYRETYETDEREFVNMPDGRRLRPHDDEFKVRGGWGSCTYVVPDDLERVSIPLKEIYPTFGDYMEDIDMEADPETGRYGYWENPNRKWDWWMVGGRWRAQVRASDGDCGPYPVHESGKTEWRDAEDYPPLRFDSAKIGDMIWEADEEAAEEADLDWRAWVDGEKVDRGGRWSWSPDWLRETYGDKAGYILCESTMWWGAVVTPDGDWHELGELGMAHGSNEAGATVEWAKGFKERFIDPYPPEYLLTVVDCHI